MYEYLPITVLKNDNNNNNSINYYFTPIYTTKQLIQNIIIFKTTYIFRGDQYYLSYPIFNNMFTI